MPGERDNARNNARCTQARKTTHSLDGQHQDVDIARLTMEESRKYVGPIRHCEPLQCHSLVVATVARRLHIDVHNDDDDDNNDNA